MDGAVDERRSGRLWDYLGDRRISRLAARFQRALRGLSPERGTGPAILARPVVRLLAGRGDAQCIALRLAHPADRNANRTWTAPRPGAKVDVRPWCRLQRADLGNRRGLWRALRCRNV